MKNPSSLLLLNQGRDESFRKRYPNQVMDLRAFNHTLALEGLKRGLKIDTGFFAVHKNTLSTYKLGRKEVLDKIEIEHHMFFRQERKY